MREASADRLMSDLRAVLEDAEALLSATAGQAGEKIARAREKAPRRQMAMMPEKATGTMKKYCQLKYVSATKHNAKPHRISGMAPKTSRGIPPSCQASTAANTRKTETNRPKPVKKPQ